MLYKILKTAANLIITLGLALMLLGLGGSARRVYADLSLLYEVAGQAGILPASLAPWIDAPPADASAFASQTSAPAHPLTTSAPAFPPTISAPAHPPTNSAPAHSAATSTQADPVDLAAWEHFDPSIFDEHIEGFLPFSVAEAEGSAPALVPLAPAVLADAVLAPESEDPPPPAEQPQAAAPPVEEPQFPRFPTRLVIPAIDLDAPVVAVFPQRVRVGGQRYEQWQAPSQFAAGFHESSAWLGQAGNTVLNGHHNIYGMVFGRLHELEQRDEIIVYGDDRPYQYRVNQVMILEERGASLQQRAENARWIFPSDDERLTLVTCWPPESNTHRLIVIATRYP
jgi:LPXTG-site transpeptidase (sortase) family protein